MLLLKSSKENVLIFDFPFKPKKQTPSANISSRPPQIPAKVRRSMSHDSVPGSPVGVSGITSGLTGVKLVPVKEKVG